MKQTIADLKMMEAPARKLATISTFPIKTTFAICRFIKALDEQLAPVNEAHKALVLKYGTEDEKTKQTAVLPENVDKFQSEFAELLENECEFVAPVIVLPDDAAGLTAKDLLALGNYVRLDEPEELDDGLVPDAKVGDEK